ncbi:hypothetical protein Salat_1137900 [Sesamum alatum]|uniref:Uncharacterized protein n=1 Tax=Sesamum alatum TaxID=300844 RepID=A0AAE1YF02_9LAMI|nr:hypothetical protein Salat_1137900 [Sesamum alatum]
MNARVAELARNLRRRNSPAAAPPPPNVEVVPGDAHVTPGPIAIIPPGARAAIEIASSGSKSTGGEVEAARVTVELSRAKKRKHKGKHASKGKSSCMSSKRSSKRAERRAAKDAAEEEENTRHFKDQVSWWK